MPQPTSSRLRELGIKKQMPVDNLRIEHASMGLNLRKMPAVGKRHAQPQAHERIERHRFVDALQKFAETFAGDSRSRNYCLPSAIGFSQRVDFRL